MPVADRVLSQLTNLGVPYRATAEAGFWVALIPACTQERLVDQRGRPRAGTLACSGGCEQVAARALTEVRAELNAIVSYVWGRKKERIRALRRQYDWIASDRVAEAVIDLAGDDEYELLVLVEAARMDWRDVLMWDEDRRNGVRRPPMTEEHQRRLLAWAGEPQERRPAGIVDVVITDAGANRPELFKVVRAITGLGLADVAAMLDELPVRVVTGTTRETAEELRARLLAAGAEAELR